MSKDNITELVEKGGLGFVDINEYILSLQCGWVKRSAGSNIDCWRLELNSATGNNPTLASADLFEKNANPILFNISWSFEKFKKSYFHRNENFMRSDIIGNPLLMLDRRSKRPCTIVFWQSINVTKETLMRLKICDFFDANTTFKNVRAINNLLNTDLSIANYNSLKNIFTGSYESVSKAKLVTANLDPDSVLIFLRRFKKGSKPIRKVLEQFRYSKKTNLRSNKIKTFFKLVSLDIPDDTGIKAINSEWMRSYYNPKIRDFVYKFHGNKLGLNTRVSHFNNTTDRGCSFCKLAMQNRHGPIMEESFEHLFYSCTHTNLVVEKFLNKFLPDAGFNDNTIKKKSFIFIGANPLTDNVDNIFLSAIAMQISYYIWSCKLKKTLPTAESLFNDVFYNIENMRKANSALSNAMVLNLQLCRDWTAVSGHRC
jgi:hypothetical protein